MVWDTGIGQMYAVTLCLEPGDCRGPGYECRGCKPWWKSLRQYTRDSLPAGVTYGKRHCENHQRRSWQGYYFPLSPEHSITEVAPPESFIGKNLGELELLGKHNLNVIAVRKLEPEKAIINPTARYTVREGDILIVLGRREDIDKLS